MEPSVPLAENPGFMSGMMLIMPMILAFVIWKARQAADPKNRLAALRNDLAKKHAGRFLYIVPAVLMGELEELGMLVILADRLHWEDLKGQKKPEITFLEVKGRGFEPYAVDGQPPKENLRVFRVDTAAGSTRFAVSNAAVRDLSLVFFYARLP